MAEFNAITFNCNGLGDKKKRQKVFTFLRDKLKKGFVFLQETHSTLNFEKQWKSQWGGEIFFSHGTKVFRRIIDTLLEMEENFER